MNPVEIDDAVTALVQQPFDRQGFPFEFLRAFGNGETTIKRLRQGSTNQSDVPGGVLQRSNIHLATCAPGEVDATLQALRDSPRTASARARFILATDGEAFAAEDMTGGDTVACDFARVPDHFGFFLPLAGITTVPQVRESSFDIKATGRLNRLYLQLLTDNPDWRTAERRADMNHFMARLIFCFFAEDTDIFVGEGLFTRTVEQWTARDASDTHLILGELFRAMDTRPAEREAAGIPRYANQFPYVNGQLFSGATDTPRFSRIARSYLLHIGALSWRRINPDIFGSMIQAVADDEERGSLGMHYTSVPNILKVLNPLFLDGLRGRLEEAGDSPRKLLNLRARMARIRVFDPACGSGNFLVIAYKEMRGIEAEVNKRRGEPERRSDIPLTNFRGIELRDFPAEIARLALIIAEYQADVLYRGQRQALAEFLPLDSQNWITRGNALRLDWLSICPPTGTGVRVAADDLFGTPLDQAEIDFENEGGETYICGNPPYVGDKKQNESQKSDMEELFGPYTKRWRSFDYIAGWFWKAALYLKTTAGRSAFVSTNSICQGGQASEFWPFLLADARIGFAHHSFKWANLAAHNAGVTCVIVGVEKRNDGPCYLYDSDQKREVRSIGPYLTANTETTVKARPKPVSNVAEMLLGNFSKDGGHLILSRSELSGLTEDARAYVRPMFGGEDFISSLARYCFWINKEDAERAACIPSIRKRLELVAENRLASPKAQTREWSAKPYRFVEIRSPSYKSALILPIVSSENREWFPVGPLPDNSIVNYAFALYDAPLWNMALIASRLHLVWIATVCGKLETRYRYSNTLGWNTFPVPPLTGRNKADLTRAAENILLAREAHFPATIAELYDPERMDRDFPDLRAAHDANDELLERIYLGRRFRNDTERLEKLFELYTEMAEKAKKDDSRETAKTRKATAR